MLVDFWVLHVQNKFTNFLEKTKCFLTTKFPELCEVDYFERLFVATNFTEFGCRYDRLESNRLGFLL